MISLKDQIIKCHSKHINYTTDDINSYIKKDLIRRVSSLRILKLIGDEIFVFLNHIDLYCASAFHGDIEMFEYIKNLTGENHPKYLEIYAVKGKQLNFLKHLRIIRDMEKLKIIAYQNMDKEMIKYLEGIRPRMPSCVDILLVPLKQKKYDAVEFILDELPGREFLWNPKIVEDLNLFKKLYNKFRNKMNGNVFLNPNKEIINYYMTKINLNDEFLYINALEAGDEEVCKKFNIRNIRFNKYDINIKNYKCISNMLGITYEEMVVNTKDQKLIRKLYDEIDNFFNIPNFNTIYIKDPKLLDFLIDQNGEKMKIYLTNPNSCHVYTLKAYLLTEKHKYCRTDELEIYLIKNGKCKEDIYTLSDINSFNVFKHYNKTMDLEKVLEAIYHYIRIEKIKFLDIILKTHKIPEENKKAIYLLCKDKQLFLNYLKKIDF